MKLFNISALLSGLIFGVGLAASGMTNPDKVIGFLDIFGQWDIDLLLVMGSAVFVTLISFRFILKRDKPFYAPLFVLPVSSLVDKQLIAGAILFGIGWGLYGYCPGPVIASLAYLHVNTFLFAAAMLAGMFVAKFLFVKK